MARTAKTAYYRQMTAQETEEAIAAIVSYKEGIKRAKRSLRFGHERLTAPRYDPLTRTVSYVFVDTGEPTGQSRPVTLAERRSAVEAWKWTSSPPSEELITEAVPPSEELITEAVDAYEREPVSISAADIVRDVRKATRKGRRA